MRQPIDFGPIEKLIQRWTKLTLDDRVYQDAHITIACIEELQRALARTKQKNGVCLKKKPPKKQK
jgi:hypothetical protein